MDSFITKTSYSYTPQLASMLMMSNVYMERQSSLLTAYTSSNFTSICTTQHSSASTKTSSFDLTTCNGVGIVDVIRKNELKFLKSKYIEGKKAWKKNTKREAVRDDIKEDKKNMTSAAAVPLDLSTFSLSRLKMEEESNDLQIGDTLNSADPKIWKITNPNNIKSLCIIGNTFRNSPSGCVPCTSSNGSIPRIPFSQKQLEPSHSMESNNISEEEGSFRLVQHSHKKTISLASPISTLNSLTTSQKIDTNIRKRRREKLLLPCDVCNLAFDRPSLLKRHLRTHTGEKPYTCDVCSKAFSTNSSLNIHRRIHSGEKPFECPICGKKFTASSNLYYHRRTHIKPQKCSHCGKSFPTRGDLKSHEYVHSGAWPYTCAVCRQGFSKQNNLMNHLIRHSANTCGSVKKQQNG